MWFVTVHFVEAHWNKPENQNCFAVCRHLVLVLAEGGAAVVWVWEITEGCFNVEIGLKLQSWWCDWQLPSLNSCNFICFAQVSQSTSAVNLVLIGRLWFSHIFTSSRENNVSLVWTHFLIHGCVLRWFEAVLNVSLVCGVVASRPAGSRLQQLQVKAVNVARGGLSANGVKSSVSKTEDWSSDAPATWARSQTWEHLSRFVSD